MGIVSLLITLFLLALIFYVLYWFVGQMPLPEPFPVVAKALLALAVVIVLVALLTGNVPLMRITL